MSETKSASTPVIVPARKFTLMSSTINKEEIQRVSIHFHRHPDDLPELLKQLNHWCLSGHDKQPLNLTGYPIDVTNLKNAVSFDEALAASAKVTCAGVGFILSSSDNIVVVDVDHCISPDGNVNELAIELLNQLPTYTEFSQSKTGLHLIYQDNNVPVEFTGRKGIIEIYYSKRYVALTGWRLEDTPAEIASLNGLTKQLLEKYFPNLGYSSSADFQDVLEKHSYLPIQSNDMVLQSLQSNQKFHRLYHQGDISGYPSQSEADGALMLILATATALNAIQMRELFNQSALGKRDKWVHRRWYQNYLINGAIQFVESKSSVNGGIDMDYINFSDYDQQQFEIDQFKYVNQSSRQTGFPTIDKHTGFPPGVYCLAAVTSAGKTAFSIQLGCQLSQQGESVIYIGYETTPLEVHSRMLARYMRLLNPQSPFSAHDIRLNLCKDDSYYQLARQQIRQLHTSMGFLKVSSQDNVDCLLQKLQHYINTHPNEKPPVIIIDYIQIIPHTGEIKNMLDGGIPKIKMFQQSTGSTFLLISSTNRASYRSDTGMEAFKESGVIEFSANVVWVLQYTSVNNGKNLTAANLEIEKARNPRKMTLKCLKNRFGADYEVQFDYYPKFDLFVESSERKRAI